MAKFQYSLDGGATYIDVPVTPGPSATTSVTLSQQGNTTLRYRAVDSSGNPSRGASTNTTLNQAAAAGATGVRLTSTAGRSPGDLLLIDTGSGDGDDRDDPGARSRRSGTQRDTDRAAGQRARRERRGGRYGDLPHDRAADRHQRAVGYVGDTGDDAGRGGRLRATRRSASRA